MKTYSDTLIIPTYKLLKEDMNPMFDRLLDPYPYTLQGFRSYVKEDVEYKVMILENEYLRLTVIPSLGGRLYSAYDKINAKEVFYKNQTVVPRMISKRGAWFSGGIEFNFPFGHAPSTMDRVNCAAVNYEDGSASIVISNIELVSYMNWSVELKLYPGKAFIEENVKLYNPTTRKNSIFFWTNAAVKYNKNIKLVYPFDWCINAIESDYIKWPYYKGFDCSNVTEIPFSYETFGKLMKNDFFGIYDYKEDYGVIHYANRKKVKGAKYFTWGNDGRAESWYKMLTDDGSKYIEIQSGPFESQKVFKFLKPHQELSWSEYWYPVSGTQGFKYADKGIALNHRISGYYAEFLIYAAGEFKDCEIVFRADGCEYKMQRSLQACKTDNFKFQLDKPYIAMRGFELDIYCSEEHILHLGSEREFSSEYPDTDIYEDSRIVVDKKFDQKLFNSAVRRESHREQEHALELYKKNLEQNPQCILTLNCIGHILIKKELFNEAEECFTKVLVYDNRNSEARFYLAVIEKEKGNFVKARRLFMDIACTESYYSASLIELAKMNSMLGYYKEGASLLENCDINRDSYAAFLLSICYRKDNLPGRSGKTLEAYVLPHEMLYAEKFILNNTEEEENKFTAFTEGDERVLVPVVLEYMGLNLFKEALIILGLVKAPGLKSRLIEMYARQKAGEVDVPDIQTVLRNSLDYVFVNEPELVKILKKHNENDTTGKIDYLLGTYYYAIGRKDDALEFLLSSYDKGLRYSVLLRNIGYIYYNYKEDIENSAKYFDEDILLNNGVNEDSIVYLDRIFKEKGDNEGRKKLIHYMENASNKSLVLISLVELYRDVGEEDKALDVLRNNEFENWEGFEISGRIFRSVIISAAMKEISKGCIEKAEQLINDIMDYPEKLNGKDSLRSALSDMYYYKGLIYSLAGKENKAIEEFKKGAVEPDNKWINVTDESKKCSMKCLEELHKRDIFYC